MAPEYERTASARTVRTAVAIELVDLAVQAVDGTKVYANAAVIRTYDARRLQELLERVESAIELWRLRTKVGRTRGCGASSREVWQIRKRCGSASDRRRTCRVWSVNRYKRPARINLTDKDARLPVKGLCRATMSGDVSPVAAEGVGGMLVTASDVVDEPNDTARLTQMAEQAERHEIRHMTFRSKGAYKTLAESPVTSLAGSAVAYGKHVAELHHGRPGRKASASGDAGQGPANGPSVPQRPVHIR